MDLIELLSWRPPSDSFFDNHMSLRDFHPDWIPVAGIRDTQVFSYDIVGVFFDPTENVYFVAATQGDVQSETWTVTTTTTYPRCETVLAAVATFRDAVGDKICYPANQVITAVGAILAHGKVL